MRDWDARAYHRVSDPQFQWGLKVLQRMSLRGDEFVVDAGCGSGRLTAELLRRLPQGRVLAVDASADMVREAEDRLKPEFGERVVFRQSDLRELNVGEPADGIFSTATFHWIPERNKLFAALFSALKPGGWLVAQCGAAGNLRNFWEATFAVAAEPRFADYFGANFRLAQDYLDPEVTAKQLRDAGFDSVETWTEPAPVTFADAEAFEDFVSHVNLTKHLKALPAESAKEFVSEVAARCGLTLDYIRLNIRATRPA